MAFWGMILSYFYFNAEILDGETGESVKVRDALRHFFNSPLWKNFYRLMEEFFHMLRTKGFSEAFEFLSKKLDPSGRHHALEVSKLYQFCFLKAASCSIKYSFLFYILKKHVIHFSK